MNRLLQNSIHRLGIALVVAALTLCGGLNNALSAPLFLSKVPLFVNESVDPNFILTMDNSTSMLRGFVPDAFDDGSTAFPGYFPNHVDNPATPTIDESLLSDTRCWWMHGNWSFSSEVNKLYYDPNVTYLPPKKADRSSMPNRSITAAPVDGVAYDLGTPGGLFAVRNLLTEYAIDWETKGLGPQLIYHGPPAVTAEAAAANNATGSTPGNTCDDAPVPVVLLNGLEPMIVVSGRGANYRTFPFENAAFYYQFNPACIAAQPRFDNACYTPVNMALASAEQQTNFANWYSYYRTRRLVAASTASLVFDGQQNLRVAWQALRATPGEDYPDRADVQLLSANKVIAPITPGSAQRNDLFNFILKATADVGATPNKAALLRVIDYFGGGTNKNNDFNSTNPYWDSASNTELSCRKNYHLLVTDGAWNNASKPLGSDNYLYPGVIGDFDSPAGPVNLPDGREYSPTSPHTRIYALEDSKNISSLADNGFFSWATDLRPNLPNDVPAVYEDLTVGVTEPGAAALGAGELPSSRDEIYFNPKNDPATWQHVVNYIVGFGVSGNVPFSAYDSLRLGTYPGGWPSWGPNEPDGSNGSVENPEALIDDTWHAAINSRGEFFTVNNPDELVEAMSKVFLSVAEGSGTNTPLSVSSGLLTTSTLGFTTSFDTSDWSGQVTASYFINDPPVVNWDAACILTGGPCPSVPAAGVLTAPDPNTRIIATRNPLTNTGIPFRTGNLSAAQQAALNTNPDSLVNDGQGTARLNYIRGDRSGEAQNGPGNFRNRKNLLGAVVHSLALYPRERDSYEDGVSFEDDAPERATDGGSPPALLHSYTDWANGRAPDSTIYVGANDGMLHAFDASENPPAGGTGGSERWAFIPSTVFPHLNKLTSLSALQYQSYVDSTPTTRDVFMGSNWRRVLVGGLRLGGQGIYALDVSNPVAADENALAGKVLWEFSDQSPGGANLGYTYGVPFITRLANQEWVVLVPGGYNSDEVDAATGNGHAVLFVLRIADGAVLKEFDLGAGSKGLASPQVGDYRVEDSTGEVLHVADVAFAGDLNGGVYRFDLESDNPNDWSAEKFFQAAPGQAITVQPRIVRTAYEDAEEGGQPVRRKYVVVFGTGKYLEPTDRTAGGSVNAYYGIYDQGPGYSGYPLTQANLQEQTLSNIDDTLRTLTTDQIPANKRGWFFDFIAAGERNIATSTVRVSAGMLIFTTLAPLSADPCHPAAISYLMFVDATTGGRPGTGRAGIDTNNDGVADSTDTTQLQANFDTNGDGVVDASDNAAAIGRLLDSYIAGVTPVGVPGGGTAQILLPGGSRIIIPDYEWRRRSWSELLLDE